MATLSANSSSRPANATTHESLLYDETDAAQASQAIHNVGALGTHLPPTHPALDAAPSLLAQPMVVGQRGPGPNKNPGALLTASIFLGRVGLSGLRTARCRLWRVWVWLGCR